MGVEAGLQTRLVDLQTLTAGLKTCRYMTCGED